MDPTIKRSNATRKLLRLDDGGSVKTSESEETTESTTCDSYDGAAVFVPSSDEKRPVRACRLTQKFAKLVHRIKEVPQQEGNVHWVPKVTLKQQQQQQLPTVEDIFGGCHSYKNAVEQQQPQQPQQQEEVYDSKSNFRKCLSQMLGGSHPVAFITTMQCGELRESIYQDYNEILLEQASIESENASQQQAATHVFEEFLSSLPIIQCTAMPSTTLEIVYEVLEDFIYPHICYSYSSVALQDLTPAGAAKAVTWIESFLHVMKSTCPDLVVREEWVQDRDILLEHYVLNGVRREMAELLSRAMELQSDDDIRQDPSGFLVTGFPEQIGFIYHQQLSVAKDALPPKYQEKVLVACNQELANCVGEVALKISAKWREIPSSYFCALINDTSLLSEQCEDRNQLILQSADTKEAGDALVRDMTELSLHATRFLCERIMHDLRESEMILTSVGSTAWERPEGSHAATERVVATFEDFFADLEVWLMSSDYYFPKVLKTCLDLTLETYLQSFFANTMASGVKDPVVVADELRDDYVRLVAFFNGPSCEQYHGLAGFYTQLAINNRLRVLQSLAALVDPTTRPEDATEDIKAVLSEFSSGSQSSAIVLHLGGLRKRHRSQESVEWINAIALAKKELDVSNNDNNTSCNSSPPLPPTSSYNVPDLRQSKFLRNIRPTKREIPKRISAGTLRFATSTLQLLK